MLLPPLADQESRTGSNAIVPRGPVVVIALVLMQPRWQDDSAFRQPRVGRRSDDRRQCLLVSCQTSVPASSLTGELRSDWTPCQRAMAAATQRRDDSWPLGSRHRMPPESPLFCESLRNDAPPGEFLLGQPGRQPVSPEQIAEAREFGRLAGIHCRSQKHADRGRAIEFLDDRSLRVAPRERNARGVAVRSDPRSLRIASLAFRP